MSVARFVTVCQEANMPQLEAMLKHNPELINAKYGKSGRTGLMMAAHEGRAQVAEVLLQISDWRREICVLS